MHDAYAIAIDYLDTWNQRHAAARREQIARLFAPDATYADPLQSGAGIDTIDALIGSAQQQFGEHRFMLRGIPDGHNNVVRFGWSLLAPGGAAVAHGLDIATVAADGRLASVTGFLDRD